MACPYSLALAVALGVAKALALVVAKALALEVVEVRLVLEAAQLAAQQVLEEQVENDEIELQPSFVCQTWTDSPANAYGFLSGSAFSAKCGCVCAHRNHSCGAPVSSYDADAQPSLVRANVSYDAETISATTATFSAETIPTAIALEASLVVIPIANAEKFVSLNACFQAEASSAATPIFDHEGRSAICTELDFLRGGVEVTVVRARDYPKTSRKISPAAQVFHAEAGRLAKISSSSS